MSETDTFVSGGVRDHLDPTGQECSETDCGHAALAAFMWAPGHYAGFRCVCHFRETWEEMLRNLKESLAELPKGCT